MSEELHHDSYFNTEEKDRKRLLESDVRYNWVSSSRFLLYLSLFATIIFLLATCVKLFNNRYKGKPDIEIQSSTKYTPEYK